ncbi:hypothetical protein Y032_0332g2764 [Ancylostoma ceylanicum]|uniref:Uncharacterized protein n=1 Tax=Ancylostoma ceylanicum TaxID=53326 RepID=A0A016S062_9BILA|nr:hypothetical protein Y032_0332g2764 [Ancylostoma ceylanicum]
MFISFLAGDSIIIGVDSDGAVGKAADSQYQNHGTVPGVIRTFAHSSLFGDTKGEVVKGHVAAREDFESEEDYRNVLNKVVA